MKAILSIVGTRFRPKPAQDVLKAIRPGEALTLVRDLNNRHDRCAIEVWARGLHIGYIKSEQARQIAAHIDEHGAEWNGAGDDTERGNFITATFALSSDRWPLAEVETE